MQKDTDEKFLKNDELKILIRQLLNKKNAVLLAHNYQRDEIQEIANFTGDSLGLSIEATKTKAEIIVFCGVHFMAETASILSPEKTVILPRIDAGCPMADMITANDLREKKKSFNNNTQVVCYVNSSADVKAESDICCTSANAVKVTNSLNTNNVFMVPDKNLAKYVAAKSDKNITWWNGYCPTHHKLKTTEILDVKKKYPNTMFLAHPECPPDILALADHICSTSGMYKFVKESKKTEFIIGTEMGILYKLRKENPNKKFYIASKNLICPNMKITRLLDVYNSLKKLNNIVKVKEDIRVLAKRSLKKMLLVPRDN